MVAVNMPAVCRGCSRPFPSGFVFEHIQSGMFRGNTAGPCPYCGHPMGDIPDGIYDIAEGVLQLVDRLPSSRTDLLVAAGILKDHVRRGDADLASIEAAIAREAPGANPLVRLLRDAGTGNLLAIATVAADVILRVLGK